MTFVRTWVGFIVVLGVIVLSISVACCNKGRLHGHVSSDPVKGK